MTNTELYREYHFWLRAYEKNMFKCKRILGDRCQHETRFRRALLKAFYAGYAIGQSEAKK